MLKEEEEEEEEGGGRERTNEPTTIDNDDELKGSELHTWKVGEYNKIVRLHFTWANWNQLGAKHRSNIVPGVTFWDPRRDQHRSKKGSQFQDPHLGDHGDFWNPHLVDLGPSCGLLGPQVVAKN